MADEVKVTITVRGVRQAAETAGIVIANHLKQSLFALDGIEGKFGARIDGPQGSIELGENREWQRVRDSNSRGTEPNLASNQAP